MAWLQKLRSLFSTTQITPAVLDQALKEHAQEYFYSETILSHLSEETKRKQIAGLEAHLRDAFSAPNPLVKVRENICGYAFQYAEVQVVCLTEAERAQAFYSSNPSISASLYRRISSAAPHITDLQDMVGTAEDEELISAANLRSAIYLFYLNAFNMVRIYLDDVTEPDWFYPLIEAELVRAENRVRKAMGLPLTVLEANDALVYSSISNMVENGSDNPYLAWRERWPDYYLSCAPPISE